MTCTPCKRTFVLVRDLLTLMREETLSPRAQVACRTLAASLAVTGLYIIDQEIAQSTGRATYKEP